jgi:hypothetical protein
VQLLVGLDEVSKQSVVQVAQPLPPEPGNGPPAARRLGSVGHEASGERGHGGERGS